MRVKIVMQQDEAAATALADQAPPEEAEENCAATFEADHPDLPGLPWVRLFYQSP